MPFTARVKSTDRQADNIPVDCVVEQALILGKAITIGTAHGSHAGAGVMVHPEKAAAFGKTLLAGGKGLLKERQCGRMPITFVAHPPHMPLAGFFSYRPLRAWRRQTTRARCSSPQELGRMRAFLSPIAAAFRVQTKPGLDHPDLRT